MAGDNNALDASARRGWTLFNGKGRCMTCHAVNPTSPMFTDNLFHNIGVSAHKSNFVELARKELALVERGNVKQFDELAFQTDLSELGRFLVTKQTADVGAFKTPGCATLCSRIPISTTARKTRCGIRSTTTTRAASKTRFSTVASSASVSPNLKSTTWSRFSLL
jgi:hypothetical protein